MTTTALPVPSLLAGLFESLRMVAFWIAVFLPAVYVPLFAIGGRDELDTAVVLGVLAVHLAAILAGHRYRRA